jgi:dodecin
MGLDVFFHEQQDANKRSPAAQRKVRGAARTLASRPVAALCERRPSPGGACRSAVTDRCSSIFATHQNCLRLYSAHRRRFSAMSDHVYKKLELIGSSATSIEDAVQNAISRASKTVRNMRWFEVTETRGHLEDNQINHWQVTVKVGFTLDR